VSTLAVPDVFAGHWTGNGTGVTVVLLPEGTVGSGEVRGGAPATRELALLEPGRVVERVDAVVFTGGSAFGLAAADGVMAHLHERGRGFPTSGGPVPIVPTAAIYDLTTTAGVRPGSAEGRAAAEIAERDGSLATGRVGAGTGATVGKWRGRDHAVPGGLGVAHARVGDAVVVALAVVNALGDVVGDDGQVLAGSTAPPDMPGFPVPHPFEEVAAGAPSPAANTTLVLVITDGRCDKLECQLVAHSAHDGFARSLRPAHTRYDGDLTIACSTGTADVHLDRLRATTTDVVAASIRAAVEPG
jgi:L-aminopeptidase/D-esterase-like protein